MRVKLSKDRRNKSSPYVVRWSDGPDPITGKPKWHQKSFRYKLGAEKYGAELRAGVEEPRGVRTDGVTLSQFRKQWSETRGQQLGAATVDLYCGTLDRLEAFFGKHKRLCEITPQQAEKLVASQRRLSKTCKDKPLSQATRDQIIRNCKALFSVAIVWKYVTSNPFDAVQRVVSEQRRFHRLTPKEEKALLEAAPTLRHRVLYDVLLTTGARLSEVLSRTWADFDFDKSVMIISNREGTDTLPPFKIKTHKQRVVPLSEGTVDMLTRLQDEAPEKVPFVFLTEERYELVKAKWLRIQEEGKPWKNRWLVNHVLRDFKQHCHRAGIEPVGQLCLHTLRKNTGQNLADARLPVNVVQAMLGHSDSRTTLKYYSQVDSHHLKQVVKAIEKRRSNRQPKQKRKTKRYVKGTY